MSIDVIQAKMIQIILRTVGACRVTNIVVASPTATAYTQAAK